MPPMTANDCIEAQRLVLLAHDMDFTLGCSKQSVFVQMLHASILNFDITKCTGTLAVDMPLAPAALKRPGPLCVSSLGTAS